MSSWPIKNIHRKARLALLLAAGLIVLVITLVAGVLYVYATSDAQKLSDDFKAAHSRAEKSERSRDNGLEDGGTDSQRTQKEQKGAADTQSNEATTPSGQTSAGSATNAAPVAPPSTASQPATSQPSQPARTILALTPITRAGTECIHHGAYIRSQSTVNIGGIRGDDTVSLAWQVEVLSDSGAVTTVASGSLVTAPGQRHIEIAPPPFQSIYGGYGVGVRLRVTSPNDTVASWSIVNPSEIACE